jgi:hypothetical protein
LSSSRAIRPQSLSFERAIRQLEKERLEAQQRWDRPREKWPRAADGAMEMFTRPLDLDSLLAEAESRSGN